MTTATTTDVASGLLPHQRRFMSLAMQPDVDNAGLIGGFGCGKTVSGCRLAIMLAYANPGLPGLYACLDYPILKDAILPVFEAELHKLGFYEGIDYTIDHRQVCTFHTARNAEGVESVVYFRPADGARNLRKLVSNTYAWAVKDESGLYTEDAHRKIEERVRHGQASVRIIADVTTPEGLGPLYDTYVTAPRKRAAARGVDGLCEDEPNRLVRGRTYDNPHLDTGYVTRLLDRYDQRLVNAYLEGHFVPMDEGLCFRFEEWTHATVEAEYDEHLPICLAWDFNVNPMSVTLNHVKPAGAGVDVWTFDEIVRPTSHTEDACMAFLEGATASGRGYADHVGGIQIYGDASGRSRSTKAHLTDYDIIADQLGHLPDYREMFPLHNPSQRESINTFNALLRNGHGETSYRIHPRCVETIKSLQTTRYDDRGGIYKGEDSYEHLTDGLRYLAWEAAPIHDTLRRGSERARGRRRV
jgi:hypothetical protein